MRQIMHIRMSMALLQYQPNEKSMVTMIKK
jgi:hypothetical protein